MRVRTVLPFLLALAWSQSLAAQSTAPSVPEESQPPPAIRRWVDVETLQITGRYRWTQATDGTVTTSAVQTQPQIRARFPIDAGGRYTVNLGAFGGSSFISGWNNTGAGLGNYAGAFAIKQLFLAAAPGAGLNLSAGGLYLLRGDSTEITTYDNDGYIVGERVDWRHGEGPVSEVALTTGYLGDTRDPNLFHRWRRIHEWNYEQFLIGWRLGRQVTASTDYTHEGERDTLREAMTVRLPRRAGIFTALHLELYERVSPDTARGMAAAADLRPHPRLTITGGVAHVDRNYGSLNADRFDRGTRAYTMGSYALTEDLSLGWYWTEAFANDYPIQNRHRVDILATFNPLGRLRHKRVF